MCCEVNLQRIVPLSLSKAESYSWFCVEEKVTLCSHRLSDQKVPIICSSIACLAQVWTDKHNQQSLLCLPHGKTCTSSALKIRVWATSKHWGFKKHNPQTLKTHWNFQDVKVLLKLLMYQSTFWSSETWQFNLGNMWENRNFNLNIARPYCNFPQVYSFEEHAYFPPDSWLLKIAVSFLKGVINSTVVISASKSTTKFNRQWGKLLLMDASHILNKAHSYALLSVWFFSFLTWFLLCSWSASSYKALTKAIQGLLVTASD